MSVHHISSRNRFTVAVLAIALALSAACSPSTAPTPTFTPEPGPPLPLTPTPPLDLEALKNAQYQGIYEGQTVQLTDGRYEGPPFVEGGASRPTVIFVEPTAFGDLNGDGLDDATVLLVENSGGSGSFVYLAAVLNVDGQPHNVATQLLGDRAQVEVLRIEEGKVGVGMFTHGPNDPMCCPSLKVVDTYELQGDAWALLLHEEEPPPLTAEALLNAEYTSEWPAEGVFRLVDGHYEEEIAPGSASKLTIVAYPDMYAFGDLNGDGAADGAIVLATSGGGSGTFISLEAVLNDAGEPRHVATASLGDRARLQSLSIDAGVITVQMVTHGPNDPMCCPSLSVVETYELQDAALVQTSRQEIAPPPTATPEPGAGASADLLGPIWTWQHYSGGGGQQEITVPFPASYRLEFLPDGTFQAKADCNQAAGGYSLEGSELTLQLGPTTLAECQPGSFYDRYLALLGQVASYAREGDKLLLTLAADAGSMTFGKWYAVSGTVRGPEGAAFPAGARVEAVVADAAGTQVGGVLLGTATQFPVRFEASYYSPAIAPEQAYFLTVTIKDAAGSVVFQTPEPIPVLTLGYPTYHLEVQVEAVAG